MAMHQSINPGLIDFIARGYCNGAAWADAPEGSRARFSASEIAKARAVCAAFCEVAGPLVHEAIALHGVSGERFGTLLWLTRCGHGCGFWDENALATVRPECPPFTLQDRDAKPYTWGADSSLGDALSAIAYGTDARISSFAYPSLSAYRGWLYFEDSAGYALTGQGSEWPFWQQWVAAHKGA